jgi:signal transduction histidine kinase
LADGRFTPAPVDEHVDPFLLPLHRQFNELARRLQELEAAHRTQEESLHAKVRAATGQLLDQQRSLARAERLAATGELAASVAHELRNPLAGLQMTLSNLRAELHDAELTERVDLMIHEVARLTRLLNELLDAARHAPEPARPLRLAELVDEMLALTRYQLAASVRLESGVDPAFTCRMPLDRLRQALLNLILNAAGALGERAGVIRIDAAAEGGLLRIAVTDDGPGFPPELLNSGIRPFFSTRERGTGLGLAMVRRFARDLGGTLELTNVEPHGARVTLVLPTDVDLA